MSLILSLAIVSLLSSAKANSTGCTEEVRLSIRKEVYRELLPESGWFVLNGSDYAYKLTNEKTSWKRGRELCRQMNADLSVTIKDDTVRWLVAPHVYRGPEWIGLWVGLTDKHDEGRWKWVDGELARVNDIVWSFYEPNGGKGENCGELWGEPRYFTINDASCNGVARFSLCELKFQ
ncbi:CD209 antigen-like protein D [Clavelina lepadiformis]|uniref:C-type lectin domain-containing protein n=1 Tax=Clavelina lepadiformis TaxID=159417 RepID=A0ABP0H3I0_CLALP